MANKTKDAKPKVPYIPFKTFVNFISMLKDTVVPHVVDTGLLVKMSGSMQRHLILSLRYFNLIDADGVVQNSLHTIVNAYNTDSWTNELKDLIDRSYSDVIGQLSITTGTGRQLQDAFRSNGNVEGQVLDKAVRFYLAALKEAGVAYSPFFSIRQSQAARKPPSQNKEKKKPPSSQNKPKGEKEDTAPYTPTNKIPEKIEGYERITIPLIGMPDGALFIPENLSDNDLKMAKRVITFLMKVYTGEEDNSPGGAS